LLFHVTQRDGTDDEEARCCRRGEGQQLAEKADAHTGNQRGTGQQPEDQGQGEELRGTQCRGGEQPYEPRHRIALLRGLQNATSGTIDGFRVEKNGSLTKVTTAEGLPAFAESGMEGIAAM
jgi:hypothetical protein